MSSRFAWRHRPTMLFCASCFLLISIISQAAFAQQPATASNIKARDAASQDVDAVLASVGSALNLPEEAAEGAFRIEGQGTFSGEPSTFGFDYDDSGRYMRWIKGPLSISSGFDGEKCWKLDWNKTPQLLEMRERDEELLGGAFASMAMFSPGAAFEFALDESASTDDALALTATPKGGTLAARIMIDRTTSRPVSLKLLTARGSVTTVEEYREFNGRNLPAKASIKMASGQVNTYEVNSVKPTDALSAQTIAYPAAPADFTFDSEAPAALPLKQAASGHLLVQAQINGDDPAWFILDTGAGSLCISTSLAAKLNMPGFGTVNVQGVGGSSLSQFRRAESMQVGPLTMQEPIFVEMDLDFLEQFMGVPISGILGFEMFSRCVAEIDFVAPSVNLHDASQYELAKGSWEELFFDSRHPAVRGTFDNTGEGIFMLDTGAAGSTLVFHTPTVKKLNMLEGRETTSSQSAGVGGAVNVEIGTLSSFRFGGHEFKDQQVGFATEDHGAFANEGTTGVIGGVWIRPFTMVLDYSHKRIAFVKKD